MRWLWAYFPTFILLKKLVKRHFKFDYSMLGAFFNFFGNFANCGTKPNGENTNF